ncbi:MAG TPA: HepT-like ribonuclease domain-containing protein [Bryobacteraceae bacterium]|nr:HepT-like ribonuclease domain-containing protein [Bryobacteraceae bacterium]
MQRDHRYLADVVEAADLIAKFLIAKGQGDFLSDDLLHNAVLRQLIIVGEAVTHLSTEFCASHPEIPVRPIANFRHRVVHDYSGVDMDLAWRIATSDLPILRE